MAAGEPQWVVCGAHNFEVGDLVAVIPSGRRPADPKEAAGCRARKTLWAVSAGMICSHERGHFGLRGRPRRDHRAHRRFAGDEERWPAGPGRRRSPVLGLDRQTVEVNVTPTAATASRSRHRPGGTHLHTTSAAYTDKWWRWPATGPRPTAMGMPWELADGPRSGAGSGLLALIPSRGSCVASTSAPHAGVDETRLTGPGMHPINGGRRDQLRDAQARAAAAPFDLARLRGVDRRARAHRGADDDPRRRIVPCVISRTGHSSPDSVDTDHRRRHGWREHRCRRRRQNVLIGPAHFDAVSIARARRDATSCPRRLPPAGSRSQASACGFLWSDLRPSSISSGQSDPDPSIPFHSFHDPFR